MYDIVIVKDKLPWTDEMWEEGLPNACTEFQTKGLDSYLATYKIENGRLLLLKDKKDWEDQNYHGKLEFYDYVPNDKPGNNDCWIEFAAMFTNGQVEKIEVINFTKTNNTTRIEALNALTEEITRNRNRWINKYFNHTAPVSWFRRRVWNEFWYVAGQFCEKMRLLW